MQLESDFTFRSADLPIRSFRFFKDFRAEKNFCDVTFTVGTRNISAHRIIVVAAIPFFQEALSTHKHEIVMPDISPEVFECLIDFAYSCELKITMENVRELLYCASRFKMDEVRSACCEFLAERLGPENAVNFRELAVELYYPQLMKITDHYIKERFTEIYQTEEFLSCPFSYIKQLVGKDDLQVDSEEKVLEAVIKWVKAFPDERKDDLPKLLRSVRMPLITASYLADLVEREELIQMSTENRNLIDEARNYNLFPQMRKETCSFSTEPRQFIKTSSASPENLSKERIYIVCNQQRYIIGNFDFSPSNSWSQCCDHLHDITYISAAALNNQIYAFLWGFTLEYDPAKNESKYLSYCRVARICSGAASLNGKIYVCGGETGGGKCSDIVECFDPKRNSWTMIKHMRRARSNLCAVTLGEYIYALGGNGNSRALDTVERCSSVTGEWQTMAPMLHKRCGAGATALNERIYVCGGKSGLNKCVPTAEMYDPLENKWELISPMETARWQFTLACCRGKLYALGGRNVDGECLRTSEVYEPEIDKWGPGPQIKSPHRVSGAVVM